MDLRYQATIIRTARECQVNSGVMTMKVGIEGRVITGPAGGPGTRRCAAAPCRGPGGR